MLSNFLAYGPEHHALEAVMRLHAVKRWHMIDTTRQQTLAEHSANVAILAMYLARTLPMWTFDDSNAVAAYALTHDLEEAFTGDIPTHSKKHIQGMAELESAVMPSQLQVTVNDNSKKLIKLCDLADGIRFIRLHGVDMTARHAQEGLERQFTALLESVPWPANVVDQAKKELLFYAYENS